MKRLISLVAAVLILLPFVYIPKAKAINFPLKTPIQSESAILINLDADIVLYEKNPDVRQMPGPLVNIMTAIIVLEECDDLNKEITIEPDVYMNVYESLNEHNFSEDLPQCDLCDGDVLTISDLLYCMMLTSSVEASETLAYHVGNKNTAAFVDKMNAKAKELGMANTNFTNATGMYDENQYTTAHDMATLTLYALDVPLFNTIATTASYNPTVPNPEKHQHHNEWIWKHSNIMMDASPDNESYYMGAKGIKTANLIGAGRNIISLASKDGNNYLAVLLKAPYSDNEGNISFSHISDAASLFDWGFKHFSYQIILADTVEIGEREVTLAEKNKEYVLARPAEEFSLLWYDEVDTALIKKNITWYKDSFRAPVKQGDVLGEVTLEYSGEVLGTIELVAVSDVERSKSKYNLEVAKRFPKSQWFRNALTVSIILCVIYILICVYSWVLFKSKAKPLKPIYAVPKMNKKKKKKKPADKQ